MPQVIKGLLDDAAQDWRRKAKCPGSSANFFPERGESIKEAKAVCGTCEVRQECLEFAIRIKVAHGIWGGLSERERRSYRRSARNRRALSR